MRWNRAEEARALAESAFGPGDARAAMSVRHIGDAHLALGDIEPGGAVLEEALRAAERIHAEEPGELAGYRQAYAGYLEQAGRGAEAAAELRLVADAYRRTGEHRVFLASALSSLGSLQTTVLDEREEGAAALQESVDLLREEYGEAGNRSLGVALLNLGGAYHNLRRYDAEAALPEAEAAFERAVEFSRRVIGPEHMHTAYPVAGLAGVRRRLGKLDSSERLYREAYGVRRTELGESHSLTVKTAFWLGRVIA